MKRQRYVWLGAWGLAAAPLLSGCRGVGPTAAFRETTPTLTAGQTADLQLASHVERPNGVAKNQPAFSPMPGVHPQAPMNPVRQAATTEHLPEHHIQAATLVQPLPGMTLFVELSIPSSPFPSNTPQAAIPAQAPAPVSLPASRPETTVVRAPEPVIRPAPQAQVKGNSGKELSEISKEDLRDIQVLPSVGGCGLGL